MKLNALKFAVAGGIWFAIVIVLSTIATMLNVPGFSPFTQMLVGFYGPWGYSVSNVGLLTGAFWGFTEGFIQVGIFVLIYNMLVGGKK